MQDPARFERGTCTRQAPLFTSHKCEDSRGTAGAVLDLDRCDDERSSRRRQAAEIRHIFEVIFLSSVSSFAASAENPGKCRVPFFSAFLYFSKSVQRSSHPVYIITTAFCGIGPWVCSH